MRTVSTAEVATDETSVSELPERVQEALGELAGAAKEGLLALSVGVGLGVLHEILESEVDEVGLSDELCVVLVMRPRCRDAVAA